MGTERLERSGPTVETLRQLGMTRADIEEISFELGRGEDFFLQRVKALGPQPHHVVLDAACGIGTWSLALASLTRSVVGFDIRLPRVRVANAMRSAAGVSNATFLQGDLHDLPFASDTFDVVICSGALMFVRSRRAVRELVRVLRPGGLIYLSMNGIGWAAVELPRRALVRRRLDFAKGAARTLAGTLWKWSTGQDVTHTGFSRSEIVRLLQQNRVAVVCIADEGRGKVEGADANPQPAYRGSYAGLNGIFEVFGRKCTP